MRRFFIGLHQPSDTRYFYRACVSINRLRKRQKSIECEEVLIDSGAFTELAKYGEYRYSPYEYALDLYRLYTKKICNIVAAVTQDYMCEQFMLNKTGLSIEDHQRLTIERYDQIKMWLHIFFKGNIPFHLMPVLQGYQPIDYFRHVLMYGSRLTPGMWVGVGSVCKRNSQPESIAAVLRTIKVLRPDLQLHGFGVKLTAFTHPDVVELLDTSDSMAWSYSARFTGGQNDWREAKKFDQKIGLLTGLRTDLFAAP